MTDTSDLYAKATEAHKSGDLQTAHGLFSECVRLAPQVSAHHLALALTATAIAVKCEPLKQQAVLHAQQAAQLEPTVLGNWIGLGEISLNCDKFPEAIAAFEHVLTVDEKNARVWGLCGFAYAKIGNQKKAQEFYEKAVDIDHELGDIHFLLSCLFMNDDFNPTKQAFHGERGFLAKRPAKLAVESCWNAAHGFLTIGEFEKGWKYFECRHNENLTNIGQLRPAQRFSQPMWKGEENCTVRIHHEMGLGDAFFMARYLNAAAKKAKIIFECQPSMIDLMRYNFPEITCIKYGEQSEGFDYHLPMMSLPHVLGTKFLWERNYLKANPENVSEWKSKLHLAHNKLNVGIAWSAGKNSWNAGNHETHKRKSVPFESLASLWKIQGVNFISLQVGNDEKFPNVGIKDFSDTAAIVSLLDLVIVVDSAVANLAGAMGANTWLMDRWDHDWRWTSDSLFPSVKVFRQTKPGDWGHVIERINVELEEFHDKMRHHAS